MKSPEHQTVYTATGLLTPERYAQWFHSQSICGVGPRSALILAGGRSQRMGRDKALLTFQGHTLLEWAVTFWRASGAVDQVLVAVGKPGHLEPLPEGAMAVPDLLEGRGPLAGLQAAFRLTQTELLYVSGVDMPFLSTRALLPEPEGDAIVYRRQGRPEPLFGIYRRSALPVIEGLLLEGQGKMRLLLERLQTTYIEAGPELEPVFRNLNSPKDLLLLRAGNPPMIAVTGWSGTGKTTALEGLIPALIRRGLRVAVIKHDAHGFQLDQPGKDTYRLRRAGACAAAILGPGQWGALGSGSLSAEELREKLPPCDLVLAEGFKFSSLPKIEIHRKAAGQSLITHDDTLLAVLTDEPLETPAPQLELNDYDGCAGLLCEWLG